ncbi:hypothetical protein [Rickettsiella massiliensis]|uniref:hypothetical protein n=1 Tax=Rickettsiella massiliensis TaxID=676517 RepID=UPI0002EF4974|nr:hypothetical protein [Rickettsiella massiliensis]
MRASIEGKPCFTPKGHGFKEVAGGVTSFVVPYKNWSEWMYFNFINLVTKEGY